MKICLFKKIVLIEVCRNILISGYHTASISNRIPIENQPYYLIIIITANSNI